MHMGTTLSKPVPVLEVLKWHDIELGELPDDSMTVMLDRADADEPWGGYLDGETWRDLSGMPCQIPTHWAEWPRGVAAIAAMPAAAARKGPRLDVQRWTRARELQQQGMSLLEIGLELEPPCAASVVWKGLRRLARQGNVGNEGRR